MDVFAMNRQVEECGTEDIQLLMNEVAAELNETSETFEK